MSTSTSEQQQIIIADGTTVLPLVPYQTPEQARRELQRLQSYVKVYLLESVDYGKQPGTDKDTLFKSGAEKLLDLYRLRADYEVTEQICNWGTEPFLFDYTFKAIIYRADDTIAAIGYGNCNSWESKYRWRDSKRKCPSCGAEALSKSKEEWGGGYYCNQKIGGCGAGWKETRRDKKDGRLLGQGTEADLEIIRQIDTQTVGRVPNPDIASQKNTVIKMAKKRALVDAAICATRSSGIFTQDVGDPEVENEAGNPTKQQWKELYREGMAYGAVVADMQKFCKDLQDKGMALKDIFIECARFYVGEQESNEMDFDALDVDFQDALNNPDA
jgi:hypothetical protein